MNSRKARKLSNVQDEEAISLIEKNDALTLSPMQFLTMMVNVLKYSNSAYMTFLAIEQHISALDKEDRGNLDYTPYFVFLCTLLLGVVSLIIMKYRAAQFENVFDSFFKEDRPVVIQINSKWFKRWIGSVSTLLIGGYIYIAYYHLIYKAYDQTRLLLFFVMGTGVFSFLISAKECFGAFNSYKQVQSFEVGTYSFEVEMLEESHLKKLKTSSLGKAQSIFISLFTISVEFYIAYTMIMYIQ